MASVEQHCDTPDEPEEEKLKHKQGNEQQNTSNVKIPRSKKCSKIHFIQVHLVHFRNVLKVLYFHALILCLLY